MRQFLLFLLSGGIAAFLNWASRFLFSQWVSFEVAVVLAFFVGLVSGFVLMRLYVFKGITKPVLPQMSRYVLINLLALLQTLVVSIALASWVLPGMGFVKDAEALGHLTGVLVPVVSSYFGHRYLTFR